ncbi:MAG: hypothetical protein QNJ55_03255 [Xenococcus sp. MO_188.B8]|nr:hypothetical protein [Xenococcus sp. MO_188.B8]
MSNIPQPPSETKILGTFASLVGLLGIFLYFTGWLYRWAYYSFFQLEIIRLDFPIRSFLFVPIQVCLGDFWAFGRTALVAIATIILIKFTLWLLQPLNTLEGNQSNQGRSRLREFAQKLHRSLIARTLRSLAEVFPQSLRNDTIIVTWLLVALFWLARIQGTIDARRDAINDTSLLPVITFVTPEKSSVLGRNLDNLFLDPSLEGYRIIGDKGLFDYLRGRETNDVVTPENTRVWRLLLENNGWFYLFPALPPKADRDQRPPVLAIRANGSGELMILSPDYTKPDSK